MKEWRKELLRGIRKRYESEAAFLAGVNFPLMTQSYSKLTNEEAIVYEAPKLHELEYIYSTELVKDLIFAYTLNFQDALNFKDENKLNEYQIDQFVHTVLKRCRGLTIVELSLMFHRFLSGEFGTFYGNIDIMVLGEWVRQFMSKRGDLIVSNPSIRAYILKRDQNKELTK